VHIYALKTKDGQYTLTNHDAPSKIASHSKSDLPPRRISSNSPAPPEFGYRSGPQLSAGSAPSAGSPAPSAPGTPTSMALPMNPPSTISHSRRSSLSSRRSLSPAPSMPLPAVMPMEASPKPLHSVMSRNASIYLNETLTSFFRRLTFTPDGSLLLTPSGQYQSQFVGERDTKPSFEITNTVYIYSRGGINKPPIAHLPGHKKPSIAVKCSPIIYTLRSAPQKTKNITIDSSSAEEPIASLPEPVSKPSSFMEPPPPPNATPDAHSTPKQSNTETSDTANQGPIPTFALPYRIVYAVATQESVLLYDTQQKTPFCVVSNLHCATFTDLAWSSDGLTLLITSSDGFCSTLSFSPGELGNVYTGELAGPKGISTPAAAATTQAPTALFANPPNRGSISSFTAPSPPTGPMGRSASPARSNSTSSISSPANSGVINNPTLIGGSIPSITATNSSKIVGISASPPVTTPPETPRSNAGAHAPTPSSTGVPAAAAGSKRDASESERDEEEGQDKKKRRIAPTVVEPRS
jgi:chromatin assembly factor 1 subunit B